MDKIAKNTVALYKQMDQAILRFSTATQKTCDLAENLARSPRAIKTIKDLEAAIAKFAPTKPSVDYKISSYVTGSRLWQCSPIQSQVTIQELLLEDIWAHQEKNCQLVKKIEQIVQQNDLLTQQAHSIYDTPSQKLRKTSSINILTKTVATYMFLRHLNNPREENEV
jgi:hypothetical protein